MVQRSLISARRQKAADPLQPEASPCAGSPRAITRLFGATEIEGGFPHSEIPGSKPVRGSPGLIAAYHVLHRLSAPRHPPDTLMALDCSHRQSACFQRSPTRRRRPTGSGAKRPVLLQTHPGILAVKLKSTTGAYQTTDNRPRRTDRYPSSGVRPPTSVTECASSSQCQISKGFGRKRPNTLDNAPNSPARRLAPLQAFLKGTN